MVLPALVVVTVLAGGGLLFAVRGSLADYKAPRELVLAPVARSPNGKVDYRAAKALALERLKIAV